MEIKNPIIGILMGSDSDLPVMKEASEICKQFEIPYEVKIISAHRTPNLLAEYATSAKERGIKVIIAGAGGAAHLPGVVAAFTTLPIIGVPIQSKSLNGIDSLLSIVQMPTGVPVATVAIGGGKNAGILAAQIIAIGDNALSEKLNDYKKKLAEDSKAKNKSLENL
ncbi:MAG: 5-(carboxyamino)imidazole ribonucleotide mutase [Ignavibacteriales bacterium]|nr:5-(carboxyamino)imidazole ribonucleotide mutase [Ignavibacteriales bacterium]